MQETLRTKRVAELIRQEVSNVIRDSVHDPKVKDVVITVVKVSVDLDLARIYWTTYNNDAVKGIQAGLERSAGFIRKEILKSVRMKKVPKLEFVIDDSRQEADRIDNLLSLIEKEEFNERIQRDLVIPQDNTAVHKNIPFELMRFQPK